MQLVFFALEIIEEAFDAVEFARGIAFEQQLALVRRQMPPRDVRRNVLRARELLRFLHQPAIARLGPRLDRAVVERFARIGHDEIEIEIDRVAESLAARACAPRIVERKKPRLRLLINGAVIFAFEAIVEDEPLARGARACIRRKLENGFAVPFPIANFDRIDEPSSRLRVDGESIDHDPDRLRKIDVEQRLRRRKLMQAPILVNAIEAALLNIDQRVAHRLLRRRRQLFLQQPLSGRRRRLRRSHAQLVHDIKSPPRGERQNFRRNFIRIVASDQRAALDAVRLAATSKEQPQVIVDFGSSRDCRTRIPRRILLPNRHRRRDARDVIDVRLLHALQKLPRIRRQRLDVAPLPFRIHRVERQRRLPRSADAGHHRDGVVRDLDADVFQIVNARATNGDRVVVRADRRLRRRVAVRWNEFVGGQG